MGVSENLTQTSSDQSFEDDDIGEHTDPRNVPIIAISIRRNKNLKMIENDEVTPVTRTPYGTPAILGDRSQNAPILCLQRRWSRPYVTHLTVVYTDREPIPEGFEILAKTSGGFNADLNNGLGGRSVYLAIRKCSPELHRKELYLSNPPITDVCIINESKGETVPEGYIKICKNLNEGSWIGRDKLFAW